MIDMFAANACMDKLRLGEKHEKPYQSVKAKLANFLLLAILLKLFWCRCAINIGTR